MALGAFGMGRVPQDVGHICNTRSTTICCAVVQQRADRIPEGARPGRNPESFPLEREPVTWDSFIYPRAVQNPFLGSYAPTAEPTAPAVRANCDTGLTGRVHRMASGAPPNSCSDAPHYQAAGYTYPRNCTFDDLAKCHRRQHDERGQAACMRPQLRDPSQRLAIAVAGPRIPEPRRTRIRRSATTRTSTAGRPSCSAEFRACSCRYRSTRIRPATAA